MYYFCTGAVLETLPALAAGWDMNLQHPSYFMLIHLVFVSEDDISLHFECESSCASQISTKKAGAT